MNELLVYFAIPIATIILSIVLQKLIKCPLLVCSTSFAIFLVVTFAAFDVNFLVNTVIYTFISFLSALLIDFICNYKKCSKHDTIIIKSNTNTENNIRNDIRNDIENKNLNKKCNCFCGRR